jgi:ABC-2 type transport system ATP-binding protein
MIAVKADNLIKKYGGITAVDSLNLKVEKGKIVGLIGPDGAGKTTLIRLLTGLLRPTQGDINVAGIDVVKQPYQIKDLIGYMPQHFGLYGDLTVTENMKFYANMYQVSPEKFEVTRDELLKFSDLTHFQKRLGRKLSGGMQKKLALACNLFHTPEIIFLDEPTTGVDPISRRELWNILFKLNEQGMTIILSTPYMDEAQKCHKVGLMYDGNLLTYESPEILIQGMKDEIVEVQTEREKARKALKSLPGIKNIYPFGEALHLVFKKGAKGANITKNVLDDLGITILFGKFTAVNKISFTIKKGEIFGFLGPNGAGKSTTIRMLCGILKPTSGTGTVKGFRIDSQSEKIKKVIGYMSQKFTLYQDLTVEENIDFYGGIHHLTSSEKEVRKEWVLKMAGLSGRERNLTRDLSGGWKQRLSLGCAILHEPEILFLDEGRIIAIGSPKDLKSTYTRREDSTLEEVFISAIKHG